MQKKIRDISLFLMLLGISACASGTSPSSETAVSVAKDIAQSDQVPEGTIDLDDRSFDDEFLQQAFQPWKGDLDGMLERRIIRALVGYNRTNYYLDGADQKGLVYEALKKFQALVNIKFRTRPSQVQVVFLPVSRDRLISYLVEGHGDIAVGNLTITPDREESVDFSDPVYEGVKEVVVTHSSMPDLKTLQDLSGQEVYVRESSSYYQSLLELNRSFKEAGRQKVILTKADENLETDDILEMVNADLVKITVADDHLADFWEQVFGNLRIHRDLILRSGGSIGWAFRKDSPILKETVNAFVKEHRKGRLFGNILINRYLGDAQYVENSMVDRQVTEVSKMKEIFRKCAEEYGFEWLLLAAQGYQESRLNQSLRSRMGAVGVMQILPSTAGDPNVNVGQIEKVENNIHAGTKYLRFLADRYFDDPGLDDFNRHLFSLAAYNAGPRRIVSARRQAGGMGHDPNEWFQNVEIVVARCVGRQPVDYVRKIYKYYLSYRLLLTQRDEKLRIRTEMETGSQ